MPALLGSTAVGPCRGFLWFGRQGVDAVGHCSAAGILCDWAYSAAGHFAEGEERTDRLLSSVFFVILIMAILLFGDIRLGTGHRTEHGTVDAEGPHKGMASRKVGGNCSANAVPSTAFPSRSIMRYPWQHISSAGGDMMT